MSHVNALEHSHLLLVAIFNGKIRIMPEYQMGSKRAPIAGKADYAFFINSFPVCVVEAKMHDLNLGRAQGLVELFVALEVTF
jgi:hypothetical protein